MQMSLLRCLIVVSVLFVVPASLGKVCVRYDNKTYSCDCDINGTNYTRLFYKVSYKSCSNMTSVYDHLRDLDSIYSSTAVMFVVFSNDARKLPSRLFPANINVMVARFACFSLTTIPDDLFINQENNIREVIFETKKITAYPVDAMIPLTNLIRFTVVSKSLSVARMKTYHIKSFDRLSSKSKLTSIKLMFWIHNVNFDSGALAALTNLRSIYVAAHQLDRNTFTDVLPECLTRLRTLDLVGGKFKTFPIDMIKAIGSRVTSLDRISLKQGSITNITKCDWMFLIDSGKFKEINLSGNRLNCNCDTIPVAKANEANKPVNIIGSCTKPDNLKYTSLKKLDMCDFQHCQ